MSQLLNCGQWGVYHRASTNNQKRNQETQLTAGTEHDFLTFSGTADVFSRQMEFILINQEWDCSHVICFTHLSVPSKDERKQVEDKTKQIPSVESEPPQALPKGSFTSEGIQTETYHPTWICPNMQDHHPSFPSLPLPASKWTSSSPSPLFCSLSTKWMSWFLGTFTSHPFPCPFLIFSSPASLQHPPPPLVLSPQPASTPVSNL